MESVERVECAAERLAAEAGLDEDARFHVTMAVREAAVNAILHGNEYDPTRTIHVRMENTGADLVFVIADQGRGVDPDSLPDPLAEENLLRTSGRGIFLMRAFMDELAVRRGPGGGADLVMTKKLPHRVGDNGQR